jgi:hypothetical protein
VRKKLNKSLRLWVINIACINPWREKMDDFNSRDLFAGLAMCGLLAHHGSRPYEEVAQEAYNMADAMLNEKEKRDGGSES